MKKALLKTNICISIFLLLSSHLSFATALDDIISDPDHPFANLFDHRLYDLDHFHEAYDIHPITETESPEIQIQRLKNRKIKRIEETKIRLLNQYQTAIRAEVKRNTYSQYLRAAVATTVHGLIILGIYSWSSSTPALEKATTALAQIPAALPKQKNKAASVTYLGQFADRGISMIFDWFKPNEEIQKIERARNDLREKIEDEGEIWEVEQLYVKRKKELQNYPDRRKAIETELIEARHDQNSAYQKRPKLSEFVEEGFSLPRSILVLPGGRPFPTSKDFVQARKDFLDRTFPSLTNSPDTTSKNYHTGLDSPIYSKEVRIQLREILGKICKYSMLGKSFKRTFVLYGPTGTGKSSAARLIPQVLDIPYHVTEILTSKDIEYPSLHGTPSTGPVPGDRGTFATSALQKNSKGETAENNVMILDDIDRCFGSKESEDVEGIMKFVMGLHDLQTAHSRYFDSGLAMGNTIFIATINRNIRQEERFQAILGRSNLIGFQLPPAAEIKTALKADLENRWFELSEEFGSTPEIWGEIRTQIADFIVDRFEFEDYRTKLDSAQALTEIPVKEWEDYAKSREWKPIQNQNLEEK